jgi:hypothetical protein
LDSFPHGVTLSQSGEIAIQDFRKPLS